METNVLTEKQRAVKKLAIETGAELITEYSGRGMYGEICMGIVLDRMSNDEEQEVIERIFELGLKGFRTDSMGLGVIYYWPNIPGFEEETELEEHKYGN